MRILRQLLFSKHKEKENENKSNKTRNALLIAAGAVGETEAENLIKKHLLKSKYDDSLKRDVKSDPEERKLYRKLKKQFKKAGGILEEGKDSGGNQIKEEVSGVTKRGNKIINVHGKGVGKADALAHEIGHTHYLGDKNAGKFGKLAHKIGGPLSDNSALIGFGVGVRSGIKSAKDEHEGKEESKLNRISGDVSGMAAELSRIAPEAAASRHGYKLLKNAGASEKYLKKARGDYKKMLLTYGTGLGVNIANAELGRAVGRAIKNKKYKKENISDSEKLSSKDKKELAGRAGLNALGLGFIAQDAYNTNKNCNSKAREAKRSIRLNSEALKEYEKDPKQNAELIDYAKQAIKKNNKKLKRIKVENGVNAGLLATAIAASGVGMKKAYDKKKNKEKKK